MNGWTWFGERYAKARPNLTIAVISVIFAAQTFIPAEENYPLYMAFLAWLSAAWITRYAFKKKALLGLSAIPISLLWVNPVFGGSWFNEVGLTYLIVHSALALVWAGSAYTFLATDKTQQEN